MHPGGQAKRREWSLGWPLWWGPGRLPRGRLYRPCRGEGAGHCDRHFRAWRELWKPVPWCAGSTGPRGVGGTGSSRKKLVKGRDCGYGKGEWQRLGTVGSNEPSPATVLAATSPGNPVRVAEEARRGAERQAARRCPLLLSPRRQDSLGLAGVAVSPLTFWGLQRTEDHRSPKSVPFLLPGRCVSFQIQRIRKVLPPGWC